MELWKRYGRGLPTDWNGYRVNTGAGNLLRVLSLLRDSQLSEKVKVRYSLRMLLRPLSALRALLLPFSKKEKLLHMILDGLGAGGTAESAPPAVISMYQDSGLIYTALLQSYGIDLMQTEVDFRLLPLLIAGVSDTTALHRVMEIRTAELPAVNSGNAEYVQRLQRLKAAYGLKEGNSFGDGMNKLFDSIKSRSSIERKK